MHSELFLAHRHFSEKKIDVSTNKQAKKLFRVQIYRFKQVNSLNIFFALVLVVLGISLYLSLKSLALPAAYYLFLACVPVAIGLLVIGNLLIFSYLKKRFPRLVQTPKRLFVQLASSSLYSLLWINGLYFLFKILFEQPLPLFTDILQFNLFGLFVLLPAFVLCFALCLLGRWRDLSLRHENLKIAYQQQLKETPRNQKNPDFFSEYLDENRFFYKKNTANCRIFE